MVVLLFSLFIFLNGIFPGDNLKTLFKKGWDADNLLTVNYIKLKIVVIVQAANRESG